MAHGRHHEPASDRHHQPDRHHLPDRHRHRSWAIGALVPALVAAVAPLGAPSASATTRAPVGYLDRLSVHGDTLQLQGWALDPASSSRSIRVLVYVDHRIRGRFLANRRRADVNRAIHVRGDHGFAVTVPRPASALLVQVRAQGASGSTRQLRQGSATLATLPPRSSAGTRIVAQARKYLGVRYVYGGSSPSTGFDCSGYVRWVYQHAHVATLIHNAEAQRHQVRHISRRSARPGDLIFYMSGKHAYHVAIYAGRNRQYAAPAPGQRVKIETIWSSAIRFGTSWH